MDRNFLWSSILAEMELVLSPGNFATWVGPIKCVDLEKNSLGYSLILSCPSIFHKNQVSERYVGQLQQLAEKNLKSKCEIILLVEQREAVSKVEAENDLFSIDVVKMANDAYALAVEKAGLTPGLTFENFAVSSSNEVAHAAAKTAANKPGEVYHLIFIYGGVGVGKTHLMQAAGHEILKKNPDARVVYCTGEEFTNEIIEAIKNKTTPLFRQKYRKAKMLFLDDVQFIAGKEKVQEEFFHTFNAVHKEGGQVILTSDRLPTEIKGLENRLKSRFEGGMTVDIQKPGFELRTAILLIKAQQKKIELPMRVAQVIAANVESTRQLEGMLLRLLGEQAARKEPLTEELVKALLGKINGEVKGGGQRPTTRQIIGCVAEYFQIKAGDIKGARRIKALVLARQVAMYLLRKELQIPYTEVGECLGGRDHTTIMHGDNKIAGILAVSEQLRLDVAYIRKAIYKHAGG
ncbi:MAG: chromosomal replication initiator protein DnaA [Patescibacteria group bacterium]|nr:chromosomal replication initiator protein DnaA [Patescibacteria group bacterium]